MKKIMYKKILKPNKDLGKVMIRRIHWLREKWHKKDHTSYIFQHLQCLKEDLRVVKREAVQSMKLNKKRMHG